MIPDFLRNVRDLGGKPHLESKRGEGDGSKRDKAEKLGVKVIGEDELATLLGKPEKKNGNNEFSETPRNEDVVKIHLQTFRVETSILPTL